MTDIKETIDGLKEIADSKNDSVCEHLKCKKIAENALELLKESKKIIDMYHKADSFLEAHGWKWETIIADSTNPDKKDGEQE